MFFKKKRKLTMEESRLSDKLLEIQIIKMSLEDLAKVISAINKVIAVLPDGADKEAEQEFCEQQKHTLLCEIGRYDCARKEYLHMLDSLDLSKIVLNFPICVDTSHVILRKFFAKST